MPKELTPSVSILLAGVLIAGAIIFVNQNSVQPSLAEGGNLPRSVAVALPAAEEHIVGSPSAKIVLVEYSDFQCPYCASAHPTLKRLVEEGEGDVAWVYRHLPLESIHPEARPAALASECVAEQLGNQGFWQFADTLFKNQSQLSAQYYAEVARELGVDGAQFASCFSSEKYGDKVDGDSLDAQQNGAQGTPFTVVIGGDVQVPVSGALPYAQFASVIKAVEDRQ